MEKAKNVEYDYSHILFFSDKYMFSKTITLRPNGSMTLPKKMREKHKTIHYLAIEVPEGVLLKPVQEEIEYYENEDGSFGLRISESMDPQKLLAMFKEANRRIDAEEKKKRNTRSRRKGHG